MSVWCCLRFLLAGLMVEGAECCKGWGQGIRVSVQVCSIQVHRPLGNVHLEGPKPLS